MASGKVTAPRALRQYPPARQNGEPAAQPVSGDVARPAAVTQPPEPSEAMWYIRPSSPMPWPCIERPAAEYSQSTRCRLVSPGAATSRPTNHDSGDGQYSVTDTAPSQRPRLCRLGGAGIFSLPGLGTSPPLSNGTPPVTGVVPARAVATGAAKINATSAVRTRTWGFEDRLSGGMAGVHSAGGRA
jgi:hypothetical protein